MISKIIGNKVKNLRISRGFSQEELADLCGLDRTYITYIENAKKNVTVVTLFKVTTALGVTLSDFFDFTDTGVSKKVEKKGENKVNLVVNNIYTNQEIHDHFKCSTQGGIRVSKTNKTVTLISHPEAETNPYNDSNIKTDGTFTYTGMGLLGDQEITDNNQNGKIAYSETNGYTLHYFICAAPNKYVYKGEAKLNGRPHFVDEKDRDGNLRKVIKFPMILV